MEDNKSSDGLLLSESSPNRACRAFHTTTTPLDPAAATRESSPFEEEGGSEERFLFLAG
jgi:hypothetical protein